MHEDTPFTPPPPPTKGPGTVRLRLDRRLHGGIFTPLAPPVSVDVGLDGVGYDLLSRLHVQGEATLTPGEHPIPILADLVLPVRVLPGTRARIDVRAERSGPGGRTRLAGFDMTFTSPLAIEDIVPVLGRLPGLFEDRGLKALRSRAEGLAALAGVVLQDYADLLERPRGLLEKLKGRFGRPDALADAFTDLVGRLQGGAHEDIATVLLKRISARPIRRAEGWELDLRFSGETNYLDRVLVPFQNVRLPKALIPSFHATLDHLFSRRPAASARVRTEHLRSQDLAEAIAGMVDRFQASLDLAGEAPEVELEGTTSAAGRFRVHVAAPGTFTLRGDVKGRLGTRSARLTLSKVVLASGGTRTLASGALRVRTRGNRPLIDALLDPRPLDHLDLEVEGRADEGSTLPALRINARTDHPLLLGETAGVVALERPDFSGAAMIRLGREPAQRLDLSLAAAFVTEDGTGFDNGANILEIAKLSGEVRGSIRSDAPRAFSIALDGEARGAARARTRVSTFPELEVEDGVLEALLDGAVTYKTRLNTSPRGKGGTDWEFSGTRLDVHLDQGQARLGDRSLTLPEDTDFFVNVLEGTLGTSGLGQADVGLGWDMHERSPVLRRGRRATEIWVPELRRNAFTLQVSPSGGLSIHGPEWGLYDAHYFNALLNPSDEPGRWLDILDSDDAVDRVISSVRVLSDEAADLLEVLRDIAQRLRDAIEAEGIKEPKHVIPAPRMARLLSRLLTETPDIDQRILPLVQRVVDGEGLDVPAAKSLLYEHLQDHPFEFEVDRLLRWASRVLAPMDPEPAFPIREATPLTEDAAYATRFEGVPSAAEIYREAGRRGPVPRDLAARLARVAPWLNRDQLSWILKRDGDLPQGLRRRLRHILDVKERVLRIEEGYGGVGFAPQAVAISFFLGDTIAMGTAAAPDTDAAGISEDLIPHSLIGPRDVALLLQSGLASAWSGRAVQLNQRLLLDMLAAMSPIFLHGVLIELGENNPRILAGVLLALLDMEQGKVREPVDLVAFFTEKLGVPFPRRSDYMAGGRWARLSYYEALMHTAEQVVNEGSNYRALKFRLQEARHRARRPLTETDRLRGLCDDARRAIAEADATGARCTFLGKEPVRQRRAEAAYRQAFEACAALQAADRRAFSLPFFKAFWARNHEALIVRSVVRNAQADIDQVRHWIGIRSGAAVPDEEQALVERVVQVLYHAPEDRAQLLADPLVRLLVEPAPGRYDLSIVSCMGVITEGAQGTELEDAYRRLTEQRGVRVIRADTATGRSLEYNAGKAIEAIGKVEGPWAWIGYSQGCPNGMMAEHLLRSGTPDQQRLLRTLRTRNLLFGALNGTPHGTAGDRKFVRAMVDLDHFISHYQTLFSEQAIQLGLRSIRMALDARPVVLGMMGMRSLSRWGILPLSRAGQFRDDIPTASMRGVVEPETLPETLEFLSNVLTKQCESPLHDTQVTVEDAVGHPRWVKTPNTEALKACDIGCMVQRTHHWSPIRKVVAFVTTERDEELAIFHTPKDRHVFPWLEACARFGVIDRA